MMSTRKIKLIAAHGAVLVLAGCAANAPNPALEDARVAVNAASTDPAVRAEEPVALNRARESLARAQSLYEDSGNKRRVELEHQAYLAHRYAELAQARAGTAQAENEIEQGERERNEVLLQARTREADRRAREATRAQAQAQAARSAASQLEQEASQLQRQRSQLEQELSRLQAEQTERGLVLTLGDVLFDTDEADLKPGANDSLDRLARFMTEYPERTVLIEGHTDSRGDEQYNADLSQRRADAVRDALLDRAVASARIQTRGLGEGIPVASNDTSAGRQQNRRVEVIISDEQGAIDLAAQGGGRSAQ